MSTVPTGTYVIMNAATHTYLNVLNFQPVPGDIVNSVGNYLGNDMWNVLRTESCGVNIQSFGTGAFLAFDQSNKTDTPAGSVVTSNSIYPWSLQPNNAVPYTWYIVNHHSGKVLVVQNNSAANGAQVLEAELTNNRSQAWFFIPKEPLAGTN
ncbi:uncharacterized protein EDB91DRAFT_1080501 [Suillus paluster]|uniref:uncharacterized protein n=1 Tax=Suillus paluster TaxID=48578 RepID=UPI001B885A4B|nr:uncharacterized protein EDB91DRAFT_1080501 [Suillus paluster]KAG1744972.1 hypothetical protein EDB91DRAFT_1080501 [Suillus paluster]